jgi:hypothetical protein
MRSNSIRVEMQNQPIRLKLSAHAHGQGFDGLVFLGIILLDLMYGKYVLQIKPDPLGSPEIFGEPGGRLGSDSTLLRTMSLTVGEILSCTDNL